MRPVTVVMIDVDAEHLLELSPADDQDPVETVTSDGADPALGKRVRFRGLEGCADHFNTLAAEDLVEAVRELAVSIADEEADRCRALRERPGQLAGLLNCRRSARVCGATGQMRAPASQLDEEEHVQPSEPERLDREEIACDLRLRLRP